jgi:hypothetical protein
LHDVKEQRAVAVVPSSQQQQLSLQHACAAPVAGKGVVGRQYVAAGTQSHQQQQQQQQG